MASEQSFTPTLDAIVEAKARTVITSGSRAPENGLLNLEDMRQIPTEELLFAMGDVEIPCTKQDLDELSAQCTSSDELFDLLVQRYQTPSYGVDSEVAFLCLMELCRRWYPSWIATDTIHEHMLLGYDLQEAGASATEVVQEWQRAWSVVPPLAKRWRVLSIAAFDDRLQGPQSLRDWANDYDLCLANAARTDPSFAEVRLAFAREFDRTFPRDLYDVLRMRIEPDGTLFSEYDEMERRYEGEGHVVPFINSQSSPSAPETKKVGRNDPCPCGSGKKYKKCCGRHGA